MAPSHRLFHLCRDPPGIPGRIFHSAATVGIARLLLWFLDRNAAGFEGLFIGSVHIINVDVQPHRERRPRAAPIGQHDHSVVNADLGMHDGTIWHVVPAEFGDVESVLQKVDHTLRAIRDNVG